MSINILNLNKLLYNKIKLLDNEVDAAKIGKISKSLNLHMVNSITSTENLPSRFDTHRIFNETNNQILTNCNNSWVAKLSAWCWGRNNYGQIGYINANISSFLSPVTVVGGVTWKSISAGNVHTVAIKSDNTLRAWGYNNYGQLGDNTSVSKSSPVSVVGGFTWKQVDANIDSTAAIKSDDTLWAWGRNNMGQLGDNNGTVQSRSSPVSVVGGFTWKQVSAGGYHTAAIKSDNSAWTWGQNQYGQLGDNNGTVSSRSSPVSVVGGFTWKQISCGGNFYTAAIKSDDTLWTWGRNNYGQLGDNTTTNRSSPVSVVGGFTWKQVDVNTNTTAAIKSDDTLWSWGSAVFDNIGNKSSPVSLIDPHNTWTWKQVSCGSVHSAAIKSDDTLWIFGNNAYGQLGDNTLISRNSITSVVGGFTWKQVSCGSFHTSAIII